MSDVQVQLLHYMMTLWRRRWIALSAAWLLCFIGWIGVMMVPDRYDATTRVYIDTETLLSPLLKGMAVDVNVNHQVEIMQRTLLSRPNLESVLRMTDLDVTVNKAADKDALIKRLEEGTRIIPQGRNLFTVTYSNQNPVLAKRVVQSLLTIFVESNLGASRRDMDQARRFIDGQVQQYERQLRAAEERLAQFKREHVGTFTGGATAAANLEQARGRLAQAKSEMLDAQSRRDALSKQLATVPQYVEVDTAPQVVIDNSGNGGSDLDKRITEMEKNIDAALLHYTEQHPDVIAARRSLAELRKQKEAQEKADAGSGGGKSGSRKVAASTRHRISNPVYEQVQLKLVDAESSFQTLSNRYAAMEEETKRIEALAKTAPEVEAQFVNLDRDYQVIKKNYDEMLNRREAAKLSQDLDSKADKVQFRVVDPPTVPVKPSTPNRPLLLSLVLVASIGAGIALAFGLGQIDGSFSTVQQLRDTFALPILGSITEFDTPTDRRHRSFRLAGFGAGCFGLVTIYGGILLYLMRPAEGYLSLIRSLPGLS